MDVVLKQDVDSLGLRGEVVNVARGYARNFLLPRGLAEVATPGLVRELEKREAQRARHDASTIDEARALAARLEALELRFDVTAGPTGSLFGSVTATNVADRLLEQEKIRVDRRKLEMDSIKRIGRYTVPLELFTDVTAQLKLVVAPEGQELPPEEELQAQLEAEQEDERAEAAANAPAELEYLDEPAEGGQTPAEAAESAPAESAPAESAENEGSAEVAAELESADDASGDDAPAAPPAG